MDEIVAVMRQAEDTRHRHRLNALIVVLWRAGLRITNALSLTEPDLDLGQGSVLVKQGKNGRRREVCMDAWGWSAIRPWVADWVGLPVGALFCLIDGPTRGRAWSTTAARSPHPARRLLLPRPAATRRQRCFSISATVL